MSTRHTKRATRFASMQRYLRDHGIPAPDSCGELENLADLPDDSDEAQAWMRTRRFVGGFTTHARVRLEQRCGVRASESFDVASDIVRQLRTNAAVLLGTTSARGLLVYGVGVLGRVYPAVVRLSPFISVITVRPEETLKHYAVNAQQLIALDDLREWSERLGEVG